jgi:hypothetical protein
VASAVRGPGELTLPMAGTFRDYALREPRR